MTLVTTDADDALLRMSTALAPRISSLGVHVRLHIEVVKSPEMAVLRCSGRILYGREAARLHQAVTRILLECDRCVLNFDGVTQVDARGLGTLAELCGWARDRGNLLCVANVNGSIGKLFHITGLPRILEVYSSEEKAIEACRQAA